MEVKVIVFGGGSASYVFLPRPAPSHPRKFLTIDVNLATGEDLTAAAAKAVGEHGLRISKEQVIEVDSPYGRLAIAVVPTVEATGRFWEGSFFPEAGQVIVGEAWSNAYRFDNDFLETLVYARPYARAAEKRQPEYTDSAQ